MAPVVWSRCGLGIVAIRGNSSTLARHHAADGGSRGSSRESGSAKRLGPSFYPNFLRFLPQASCTVFKDGLEEPQPSPDSPSWSLPIPRSRSGARVVRVDLLRHHSASLAWEVDGALLF